MDLHIRDATAADHAAILALNTAAVVHTSAMDAARLRELVALADYHRVSASGSSSGSRSP